MSFEESAVAEQTEVGTTEQFAGTNGGIDVLNAFEAGASEPTDFLDTPAAKMASRPNEVHQGEITTISVETAKTGTRSFLVNLQSKDTGAAFRYNIYPPAEFFNPEFWQNGGFAVEKLSKDSPGINDKGNPKQSPYQRFGATIASTEAKILPNGSYSKFADVQLLRAIAKADGRSVQSQTAPTSGEDFGGILNELCAGLNVVFTLVLEKSAEYGDRQKVGKIHPPSVLSQANFDKSFPTLYVDQKTGDTRGFIRAWDVR